MVASEANKKSLSQKHNDIKPTYIRFSMMSTRQRSPHTRLSFTFVLTHPRGSWTTQQHSHSKVKEEMGQINKKHPVQRSYHIWWGRSKTQLQQIQAGTQLTTLHKLYKNKINTKNKIKMQSAVQIMLTIWCLNFCTTHLHNAIYCQTSHKIPVLRSLFIFITSNWQTWVK